MTKSIEEIIDDEEHLTEDDVQTPEEQDAESYAGHMPDGVNDQVNDMLEQTGMYQEADDPDTDVPEVDMAEQVEKAEKARRLPPEPDTPSEHEGSDK